MTPSRTTVFAVGSAGPFAGLVVPELAKRGVIVRGVVRDGAEAAEVRKHDAAQIAFGGLADRSSMVAALESVDAVLHVAGRSPDHSRSSCPGIDAPRIGSFRSWA